MLNFLGLIYSTYGIYCFWLGASHPYWPYYFVGLLSLVGGVGLFMKKSWSRGFVYIVSTFVAGSWLYFTTLNIIEGVFPYLSVVKSLIALFPGACLLMFCGGNCIVVSRRLGNNN